VIWRKCCSQVEEPDRGKKIVKLQPAASPKIRDGMLREKLRMEAEKLKNLIEALTFKCLPYSAG
jgi:hypothetical protein